MRSLLVSLMVVLLSSGAAHAISDDLDEDALAAKLEKITEHPKKAKVKAKSTKPASRKTAESDVKDADSKADASAKKDNKESGDTLACPPSIKVSAQKLEKKLKGWDVLPQKEPKYWLKTVSVYEGKDKPVRLEPFRNTERSSEWMLRDHGKQTYYLVCDYHETSLQLKRALPKEFSGCRVTPQPDPSNPGGVELLHKFECE